MAETQMVTVHADVPVRVPTEMILLVEGGWFRDLDELLSDALCRFVESHRAELMERFSLQDVEWGLGGDDQYSHNSRIRRRTTDTPGRTWLPRSTD